MGGVVPNPFKSSPAPAPAQQAAPSTAVVSQSSAADATQSVKRRRGKSPTILTDGLGSGGSLNTESKTLLGG